MKKYYLRTVAALACAFGLVACGGGNDDLTLQVHVSGVTKDGLTLSNNGGEPQKVLTPWTSFIFSGISSDSDFDIVAKSSPTGTTCEVINGKGKTSSYSPTNIFAVCTPIQRNVTAKIVGLGANAGLVVVNGPIQYTIPAGAESFDFTLKDSTGKVTGGQVGEGVAYGFAVLTQPVNKTCTIPNGGGIMGDADVQITINCA